MTYSEDGSYIITLITINDYGCSDTTTYLYEMLFKGLYVPNAFAPTSGVPEVSLFKPVGINLREYHIQVFSTWGHLLWESKLLDDKGRPVEGWNGTYNGELMQQGTYMWIVRAIFMDGTIWQGNDIGKYQEIKTMGTVSSIR